ncbi:amino acid adenylation domain-containing protein [Streptomyces sp. G44]|uniref:amino acid adenylation domain-containing protein n=1 Tax=Streptomyces sp. G44 TaxID=2807632 RepID=UPI001961A01B|nr:amino acid adenylation domain-containing protein [Streptomyces sp. G44]MBM7167721.1 amino acid adenylation domain-containing protein [Streptomyces sp. G44]
MNAPSTAPDPRPRRTLVDVFADSATGHPDGTAVTDETGRTTYRELDGWSLRVARRLREEGVAPGDRVALRMEAGRDAIAAILGILRSGAAYVPLDPRNPAERNAFIVADSGVRHLVGEADAAWGEALTRTGADELAALRHRSPTEPPGTDPAAAASRPSADDCAYVIYTSGTTGVPKGVPVRHESVIALLDAARGLFDVSRSDRWLLFHSLAFDFSVWEVWGALSTAGAVVVPPSWVTRAPEQLVELLAEERITVVNQTPTAFGMLVRGRAATGARLPDLRYVVFGGEKLTPAVLREWVDVHGLDRPRLVNMYGITEVTVHATFHRVTRADVDGDDSVIGTALPGFAVRVAGPDGQEVTEPGAVGELLLGGPQVTSGYLNRPELNEERFVRLPPGPEGTRYYRSGDLVSRTVEGDLVYHGRADLQVKLRGHRVELGDIESAVRSHPSVVEAVALPRTSADGTQRLYCALLVREGTAPDVRELRRHTAAKLPSYMQPARYRVVDELPRTVNGKIDRSALAAAWEDSDG